MIYLVVLAVNELFSKGGFDFLVVVFKRGQLYTYKPRYDEPAYTDAKSYEHERARNIFDVRQVDLRAKRPKDGDERDQCHRRTQDLNA